MEASVQGAGAGAAHVGHCGPVEEELPSSSKKCGAFYLMLEELLRYAEESWSEFMDVDCKQKYWSSARGQNLRECGS